ncbi:MAG: hypothetical protein PQJ60_14055 [Spirochaetales bacterium]|nr:hypothetical protein [Spirochaetales bacterium]
MKMQTYSLGKEIFKIRRKRVRIEVELGILWISGSKGIDYMMAEGEERSFNEKDLLIQGLADSNFFRLIKESRFDRPEKKQTAPLPSVSEVNLPPRENLTDYPKPC